MNAVTSRFSNVDYIRTSIIHCLKVLYKYHGLSVPQNPELQLMSRTLAQCYTEKAHIQRSFIQFIVFRNRWAHERLHLLRWYKLALAIDGVLQTMRSANIPPDLNVRWEEALTLLKKIKTLCYNNHTNTICNEDGDNSDDDKVAEISEESTASVSPPENIDEDMGQSSLNTLTSSREIIQEMSTSTKISTEMPTQMPTQTPIQMSTQMSPKILQQILSEPFPPDIDHYTIEAADTLKNFKVLQRDTIKGKYLRICDGIHIGKYCTLSNWSGTVAKVFIYNFSSGTAPLEKVCLGTFRKVEILVSPQTNI